MSASVGQRRRDEGVGGVNYCFQSDYLFSHLQELHLFLSITLSFACHGDLLTRVYSRGRSRDGGGGGGG